jgi:hypothetical protein
VVWGEFVLEGAEEGQGEAGLKQMDRLADRVERILRLPAISSAVAVGVGLVSAGVLWVVFENAYEVHYFYPRMSVAPSYPELRYTIGELAVGTWCLIGLVASVFLLRTAALRRSARGWPIRALALFLVLSVVLAVGIVLGVWLRNLTA